MKRSIFLPLSMLGLMLCLLALQGCDSSGTEAGSQQSRVLVYLTDAPLPAIMEAHVTIDRVELIGSDETITLLTDEPQPFDLLTLQNGVTALLADLEIADGTYTQARLVVQEEARVVLEDGSEEELKVPSGTQTGIKIQLPELVLSADVVEITVDFAVDESFVERGNSGMGYIFKPVLKPTAVFVNGEEVELVDDEEE